jgi:DNA-directed RNA polymerase subunit RPC12/RpoP
MSEKIMCQHCQGEMALQSFTNCFSQTVEFYKCAGCGFTLDKSAADKPKRRKAKAA